jgi:hypothetical protein
MAGAEALRVRVGYQRAMAAGQRPRVGGGERGERRGGRGGRGGADRPPPADAEYNRKVCAAAGRVSAAGPWVPRRACHRR